MASFDRDIPGHQGKRLMRRVHRPLDLACPMHLRRICGTCAGFPEGAALRAKDQPCAPLGRVVSGLRCAKDCKFWARKIARADQPKPNFQNEGKT
jgi:hypothetical protein